MDFEYELSAKNRGFNAVCGVDEAGRGPLAGPVFAAAVILPDGCEIEGVVENSILFRGFDDQFMVPQSRHTTFLREDVEKVSELKILASSEKTGIYAVSTKNGRQIFITGHSEYDADTLNFEYTRDLSQGKPIQIPENYFLGDDPKNPPIVSWRAHANLLFSNWLNYFVYQSTPYDIKEVK